MFTHLLQMQVTREVKKKKHQDEAELMRERKGVKEALFAFA
jgi:hypothetical protein